MPSAEKKQESQRQTKQTELPEYKKAPFDLLAITDFLPEIITTFQYSGAEADEKDVLKLLFHGAGQYQDMFDALLFGQTILQYIRQHGIASVNEAQLEMWFCQLHQRVAATLAADVAADWAEQSLLLGDIGSWGGAGIYSAKQTYRWQLGAPFQDTVIEYLSDNLSEADLLKKVVAMKGNFSEVKRFLILLKKIRDDKSILLSADQKPYLIKMPVSLPVRKGMETLAKFNTQYHSGKLSEDELKIVAKVVTVCPAPDAIPALTRQFLAELLSVWKDLARKKKAGMLTEDEIVTLGLFTYQGIGGIHSYFDCNGRLAGAMMSIVFRSLGYPSIVTRFIADRDDPKSSYNQGIQALSARKPKLSMAEMRDELAQAEEKDQKSHPMFAHIKLRLKESGSYKNPRLAQIITLRVKRADKMRDLSKHLPLKTIANKYKQWMDEGDQELKQFNLLMAQFIQARTVVRDPMQLIPIFQKVKTEYDRLMAKYDCPLSSLGSFNLDTVDEGLQLLTAISIAQKLTELEQQVMPATAQKVVAAAPKKEYKDEVKAQIEKKLAELTDLPEDKCKAYRKKAMYAVQLSVGRQETADAICKAFQKNGFTGRVANQPKTTNAVVELTEVTLAKLRTIKALEGLPKPAAADESLAASATVSAP